GPPGAGEAVESCAKTGEASTAFIAGSDNPRASPRNTAYRREYVRAVASERSSSIFRLSVVCRDISVTCLLLSERNEARKRGTDWLNLCAEIGPTLSVRRTAVKENDARQ
ncbi:MAG TPA: hypothetical protein VKB09_05950, partial [Thermomicrobiales bacterium]|nr:hypothetical protein [Thermomicrobiales bacterium]